MLLRRVAYYWLPVVLWMAVILGLSSQSNLPQRTDPSTGERIGATYSLAKTWHVIEYSLLSLLIFRAAHGHGGGLKLRPARAAGFAVVTCLVFAGLDELRQSFVPRREASINDVLLDTAAAFIAAAACAMWIQSRGRARSV
ncbi:MAG: VanZ family protein [Chloroflexota bacterium]